MPTNRLCRAYSGFSVALAFVIGPCIEVDRPEHLNGSNIRRFAAAHFSKEEMGRIHCSRCLELM